MESGDGLIIPSTCLEKSRGILDLESITNKIVWGEALEILRSIPSNSIQLIVTSPSYYLGKIYESLGISFSEYLEENTIIIAECNRVLKDNGAIFWDVAQTIIDDEIYPLGAIYYDIFKKLDFHLKNWIIWKFAGGETPRKRLFGRYENVLWFVKDKRNYIFNLDDIRIPTRWIKDKRCNEKGKNPEDFWVFDERSNLQKLNEIQAKLSIYQQLLSEQSTNYVNQLLMDETMRDIESQIDALISAKDQVIHKNLDDNIWYINRVVNINKTEKIRHPVTGETHPCPFPERMIERIIKMASNEGDLVLDIFMGSGTVLKKAEELRRKWIGLEKERRYCEIAEFRLRQYWISLNAVMEKSLNNR